MREIYARETFVSLEYECIKFLRAKFRHKVQWNLSKADNYPKPEGLWQNMNLLVEISADSKTDNCF